MESIFVEGAPKAIGPYCHAMRVGNLVFCSGQTPLDPETMKLVGSDIQTQTRQALTNLNIVLEGMGLSLHNIAKTTVFLKDMGDFQGMNATYARMFGDHKPARTTIAIRQNPLDALVEIECIAEIGD
jgi:2-iminobutanoate/2-iminopropanoate deaminase